MANYSQFNILSRRRLLEAFWMLIGLFSVYAILDYLNIISWSIATTLIGFTVLFGIIGILIQRSQVVHTTEEFKFKINREANSIVEIHIVKLVKQSVSGFKLRSQLEDAYAKAVAFAVLTSASRVRIDTPILYARNLDRLARRLCPGATFCKIHAHKMNCISSTLAYRQIHSAENPTWEVAFFEGKKMFSEGMDIDLKPSNSSFKPNPLCGSA